MGRRTAAVSGVEMRDVLIGLKPVSLERRGASRNGIQENIKADAGKKTDCEQVNCSTDRTKPGVVGCGELLRGKRSVRENMGRNTPMKMKVRVPNRHSKNTLR